MIIISRIIENVHIVPIAANKKSAASLRPSINQLMDIGHINSLCLLPIAHLLTTIIRHTYNLQQHTIYCNLFNKIRNFGHYSAVINESFYAMLCLSHLIMQITYP